MNENEYSLSKKDGLYFPSSTEFTVENLNDFDARVIMCGMKVSTFDMSGRKFIIEYYYLLKDKNTIVTQLNVSGIQMSVMDPDTHE